MISNGARPSRCPTDHVPERHRPALGKLEETLQSAFAASDLPDQVSVWDELDDFLVRVRLELGRG